MYAAGLLIVSSAAVTTLIIIIVLIIVVWLRHSCTKKTGVSTLLRINFNEAIIVYQIPSTDVLFITLRESCQREQNA